jgi:hypothetical protein
MLTVMLAASSSKHETSVGEESGEKHRLSRESHAFVGTRTHTPLNIKSFIFSSVP